MAKGGANGSGRRGRRRHVVRGAGTSGGGWRVVGTGDVQVDVVMFRERRWGAGMTERCYDKNRY